MTGTRVYVGNLAWETNSKDLEEHMSKAGTVVLAEVFMAFANRSKGCGIVEYESPESAKKAIAELNDTRIKDTERLIFVREDREPTKNYTKRNTEGRQVFVDNLPFSTTWQDLKDHFRNAGFNVVRANIREGREGRSLGKGTVLFESEADANKAIEELDNTELDGRPISVKLMMF